MNEAIRVLIVEDDDDSREMYEVLLGFERFVVHGTGSAREGLERARARVHDVIVCDLGLPDGSGLDVMRQLRREGDERPAIALTGMSDHESRTSAFNAGFTEFCVKPCAPNDLAAVIRRAFKARNGSGST